MVGSRYRDGQDGCFLGVLVVGIRFVFSSVVVGMFSSGCLSTEVCWFCCTGK